MAERFFARPFFCFLSPFLRNPWLEEVKKEVLCEKTPRLLIGIFLLGLVSTAPMVRRCNKEERCEQHQLWFRRTFRIL